MLPCAGDDAAAEPWRSQRFSLSCFRQSLSAQAPSSAFLPLPTPVPPPTTDIPSTTPRAIPQSPARLIRADGAFSAESLASLLGHLPLRLACSRPKPAAPRYSLRRPACVPSAKPLRSFRSARGRHLGWPDRFHPNRSTPVTGHSNAHEVQLGRARRCPLPVPIRRCRFRSRNPRSEGSPGQLHVQGCDACASRV
jgi:hypothetical protein